MRLSGWEEIILSFGWYMCYTVIVKRQLIPLFRGDLWKVGDDMPTNEKEYNGFLFDQLSILERIEAVTTDENALKQIAMERRQIERKLYQQPPLVARQQ